ncbi:MAG: mucin-associated surface protein [Myxococcales bacterium]|nr:mucin-associated surface protein [Myxococcales bacterium]
MFEAFNKLLVQVGIRKTSDPAIPDAPIAGGSANPKSAPLDPLRWIKRGVFLFILIGGWIFIDWQNHFHLTAPTIFVCLAYLAVIATVYNLWRTGVSAVAPENEGEEAWARPAGARGDLEKEKRTLLKAIKEAEFDHEMGKLSKVDADGLIHTYRTRAIEVIKELDRLDAGGSEDVRTRIQREVKARLALQDKKAPNKKGKKPAGEVAKPEPEPIQGDGSKAGEVST